MTTCNQYYYCNCVVLFSITNIFSFMFIILLVATATLDGLPPYRTVLNYFHLLWLYKLYPLLGWLCRLPGWFYSFAFTFILTCIIFHLYHYCLTVLLLPMLCPFPYIYIFIFFFLNLKIISQQKLDGNLVLNLICAHHEQYFFTYYNQFAI